MSEHLARIQRGLQNNNLTAVIKETNFLQMQLKFSVSNCLRKTDEEKKSLCERLVKIHRVPTR